MANPRSKAGTARSPVVLCVLVGERPYSLTIDSKVGVADVIKVLVDAGAVAEGSVAGLRTGNRFLPHGVALGEPWMRTGEVLTAVSWCGEGVDSQDDALRLVISGGFGAGRSFALESGEYIIGRDGRCDIQLDSPSVSATHAKLTVTGNGDMALCDLGATNGTYIGDAAIGGTPTPLRPGQIVHLGACRITFASSIRVSAGVGPVADDGRRPFHRAARSPSTVEGNGIVLLPIPTLPTTRPKFNWIALIVPLLMGLAMALLFSPTMAVFAVLGPVMSVAAYWQERAKVNAARREVREATARAVLQLHADIATQRALEVATREAQHPDPGVVLLRSVGPSGDLWQQRVASSADPLSVHIGRADRRWRPVLRGGADIDLPGRPLEIAALLEEHLLPDSPVAVNLRYGAAFGVVASKTMARSIARNVVCLCANLVGPGELKTVALTDLAGFDDVDDWSWISLLPHCQQPDSTVGSAALAGNVGDVEALLEELERTVRDSNTKSGSANTLGFEGVTRASTVYLIVVEMGILSDTARSVLRRLTELGASGATRVCVVSLAPSKDLLPAYCSDLLTVTDTELGVADLRTLDGAGSVDGIVLALTPVPAAVATALELARLRDPEAPNGATNLPSTVSLLPLLGLNVPGDEVICSLSTRWADGATEIATSFRAVLGEGEEGLFEVDFVSDGPHALVGGTTGSGKSELLRSLVASVAATYSPDDANFVLVDYKGGSAFDVCAGLPHVVGMVTDLDEQLGERALLSLQAELRWREHLLRDAEASDFGAFRRDPKNGGVQLARLMVIIDEFATMAKELPDFLSALIGIAQRGRSLGVHMLLATQRPSGVVNENIKANTNLRIALRVQDANDSQDVIGSASAASINRRIPGRAFARLGPSELVRFQAARIPSTAHTIPTATAPLISLVDGQARGRSTVGAEESVEAFVAAVSEAWTRKGSNAPRRPWLAPLPTKISINDLPGAIAPASQFVEPESAGHATGAPEAVRSGSPDQRFVPGFGDPSKTVIVVGVIDEPSLQSQRPYTWNPPMGNVAFCGINGSGNSGSLLTFAAQLARSFSADQMHLYGLDFGEGVLAPLEALPHTGAVLGPGERERLVRLIRMLRVEIDVRRSLPASEPDRPLMAVLVDNIAGVLAVIDEIAPGARDDFARLVADGPALGVCFFIAGDRPGAFPIALSASLATKIIFRLADPSDVVQFGIDRRSGPPPIVGRALVLPEKLAMQMGITCPDDIAAIAAPCDAGGSGGLRRPPRKIRSLPERVGVNEITLATTIDCSHGGGWFLPIGLGDENLDAVGFRLRAGEHALITAPAHGGKSTALRTIAEIAAYAGVSVSAVAVRSSPILHNCGFLSATCDRVDSLKTFLETLRAHAIETPQMLLIDDAESIDDPDGLLATLSTERIENLRIVVAARGDTLRSKFGHWTSEIRRSRVGLILRPVLEIDGDLWFTTLPRKGPLRFRDGLGYLITSGTPQLVQVASGSGT